MIKIINSINEYYDFIKNIDKEENFCNPFSYDFNKYEQIANKNYTFITLKNGDLTGVYAFLIIEEEKYIELLFSSSKDKDSYQEMLDNLLNKFEGYSFYFAYNPNNYLMNDLLKKYNAKFDKIQKQMIYKGKYDFIVSQNIFLLTNETFDDYKKIHRDEGYWDSDKIINSQNHCAFILKYKECVIGHIDLYISEKLNMITDIYVQPNYRNKGYGKELLIQGILISKNKEFVLQVDIDNEIAIHLYKKIGFEFDKLNDTILAIIN